MNKDNKRLLLYFGVLFIATLLSYKIPHSSYSMAQYIIRPIRTNSSVINISGVLPLILIVIALRGIFSLERFKGKSKLLLLLFVLVIVFPVMKWTIDFTRTSYHWVMNDGLNGMDLKESNISITSDNDKVTLHIQVQVIDYSRSGNKFKFKVYLPKTLSDYLGKEAYESETQYSTHGNPDVLDIEESLVIDIDDNNTQREILDAVRCFEEIKGFKAITYELYNEEDVVKMIDHGL